MNIQKIGENIKKFRETNNVLQREFAEQLFVTDKAVSRWECGKSFPDIELLPKIAEILGMTVGELLGETVLKNDDDLAIQYREECDRLRAECDSLKNELAKVEEQKLATAKRKKKILLISRIAAVACAVVLVLAVGAIVLIKPTYTLTFVHVTTQDGADCVSLKQGAVLPEVNVGNKTLLGYVDENYNFYTQADFSMPNRDITLRALFQEDMPLFTMSDSNAKSELVGQHVYTDSGIPATKFLFTANSTKGTFVQSRPVCDSGSVTDINVYVPSLGKRLILMCVQNNSDVDVTIKYRVENNSDKLGGLDVYTDPIQIKANDTKYFPVFFEGKESYKVFEGCDHFIILDQDIAQDVELVAFGYIYTAEELYGIKIVSEPNKFFYKDGETIDLTGLQVQALIKQGSVTGAVNLVNYDCNVRGQQWNSSMKSLTVTFGGKTDSISFFDTTDEHVIAFAPAVNIKSQNESGKHISAEFTTDKDGMPASRFTIASGAKSGAEVEAWIIEAVEQTKNKGINLRIPTFNGKTRRVQLDVTNEGGQEVTFYYYAEDFGDKGGVEITIAPNESKSVWFNVNSHDSLGCNYAFRLLSDVQTETSLVINGYFYCKDELSGISIHKQLVKTTFVVGEEFNCDGLVVKAEGEGYDDVVIANFSTDFNGYTFTQADVGTQTVTVKFDDFVVTYQIEVLAKS